MFKEALVNVKAKELMESPYLSVIEDTKFIDAIKEMNKFKSEYLIVEDVKGVPKGLLTIKTITRLLAEKGKSILEQYLKSIVLEPIISVKSDASFLDVIKIMSTKNLSVIAVIHKGKIMGIITLHKVFSIVPSVIEDLMEQSKFEREPLFKPEATVVGYCDRCGVWTEKLTYVEGSYYCIDCLTDIYGEEFLTEE